VGYLDRLGITDCYASPYLKAEPGSTHGYDICDHGQLNPEIGSEADYAAFTAELASRDMGQVVDFVPNHMAADSRANLWWRDVLEHGRASGFASFFDIDWQPIKPELEEKVLLPILGDQYGIVLERGELRLAFRDGAFFVRYFDHELPIDPHQYPLILEAGIEGLAADLGEGKPELIELLSIITAFRNLPARRDLDPDRIAERSRETEVARQRLCRLVGASVRVRQHVEGAVRAFNGEPGRPETFNRLHELLEEQPYRLSYWRTAAHEINYRRFFDINELAGLRMEDPEVCRATHGLSLRLIGEGKVSGLRIDHVDGLFDPLRYLERLQEAVRRGGHDDPAAARLAAAGAEPQRGQFDRAELVPLYIAVEKILSAGEALPDEWPVAGTSGYDFLNQLNGVFVDRGHDRVLRRVYQRFTGRRDDFAGLLYGCKKLIMETSLASELNVLAHGLNRLSERSSRTRDFTLNSLREALREVVACFPVYRTYVTERGCTDRDRDIIETAIRRARRRNRATEVSIFHFVRDVLLSPSDATDAEEQRRRVEFTMKFQQYTGPVQAKGLEDTVFYRYNVLASLNEVGGEPQLFGCSVGDFHAANRRRRERWPCGMLATATHDTKRGEDARARLNVLSEIPMEWGRNLSRWARINAGNRTPVDGSPAPDRNDEYLFYQALLSTWPPGSVEQSAADAALVDRIRDYMLKAVREAKLHTSWVSANEAYEEAVVRFVDRTLGGPSASRFLPLFLPFQQRIARAGVVNSLAQLVLKVASPGVPDFYQGSEIWDLSLVDPDNRRPVDYGLRQTLLEEMGTVLGDAADEDGKLPTLVHDMLANWEDGRIKLYLTARALRARRRLRDVFLEGDYRPLAAEGRLAGNLIAVARRQGPTTIVAAVPRLVMQLTSPEQPFPTGEDVWGPTRLLLPSDAERTRYRNLFTGEVLEPAVASSDAALLPAEIFRHCPVGLLVATEAATN